jgi:hypothetical protein
MRNGELVSWHRTKGEDLGTGLILSARKEEKYKVGLQE